jgi:hypothetical protein
MPAVGTYNSVTLGVNTPVQLTPPGSGYVFYILNTITGGKLYISNLNTAGNNATSFMLPANLYCCGCNCSEPYSPFESMNLQHRSHRYHRFR